MDPLEKISQLEAMLREDPSDALAWFMLGTELLNAGQNPEAVAAFKRCLALTPDHTAAVRKLADSYRAMGDIPLAREAYQAAIDKAEQTGDLQVANTSRAALKRLNKTA